MLKIQSRVSVLAALVVCAGFSLASSTAEAGTPMYRFYKATTGEHFYTATFTEGVNAGFKSEGIGFQFYSSSGIGRVAIYRCNGGGWHFISTSSSCEGASVEGQYGWIDSGQNSGDVALQRFYRSAGGDHIFTIDTAEAASLPARGFVSEGTVGYVPAYTVTTATGLSCNGSSDDTSTLQTAITNAAGGHLIIPAGSGACMVSGLLVGNDTQITVNGTVKLLPSQSGTLPGAPSGHRSIFVAYGVSNVVIDGPGTLDGNRSTQNWSSFMSGVDTLAASNVIIRGLTMKNFQNSPVNVVQTNGSVIQDITAFDSGNPVEFAGDTSNCSADGLRIYNINPPGVTSEAGFSFYGGPHSCALRNSVISDSTFGVLVLNDAAQGGSSHDIVVENVEAYNISVGAALSVSTQDGLTNLNYNIVFQHIRLHNNTATATYSNGSNVTFSDITSASSTITGNIDGFGATGGGEYNLYGWTCTTYDPDSIQVALYIGNSSGPTTGVAWFPANAVSESAVGTACASGGTAHRFVIHFDTTAISLWGGQKVWMYGISPWGFNPNTLAGSGTVTIPQ